MHLKVDAILFQNIFQQRPGQRHFEWLDASWCFSLFPIWSSRDLFYDMLCVFTQLHKPAHIVESLEMHATKNVFAKVRFYGIMVYHLVMTHIAMERSTIFKFGKPYLFRLGPSKSHYRTVSHNQMVSMAMNRGNFIFKWWENHLLIWICSLPCLITRVKKRQWCCRRKRYS